MISPVRVLKNDEQRQKPKHFGLVPTAGYIRVLDRSHYRLYRPCIRIVSITSPRGRTDLCEEESPRLQPRRVEFVVAHFTHLPRRVPSPPRVCWDLLSLHEKGSAASTERHPSSRRSGRCANADRAAGTNSGSVGFESAVLLRVALDLAPLIEDAVVADGGESPLRDVDAVVENPPANPHTRQPPDHVLERGACAANLPSPYCARAVSMRRAISSASGRTRSSVAASRRRR
jgi:hypothetical protein